ncbi:MAG TPA: hypothetical protein VGJ70_12655, partial [Solirubrobacteraceae bacterium]
MTWTRAPAHLLAGAICVGLAGADVVRVHGIGLAASAGFGTAAVASATPAARLGLAAALLCCLGWWWASVRLDALDRSPMLAQAGRAERARVTVTAPPRRGRYELRAEGRLSRF